MKWLKSNGNSCVTVKSAAVIYLSFTFTLTFYHVNRIDRPFWVERNEFHQGIINGDFKSPYQYRILSPWLAELGGQALEKALGLSSPKASAGAREAFYQGQRFIATFLVFVFFHLYLRSWFSHDIAFSGTLVLAGLHLYTFQYYFYQPDSPLDLLFLTIGAYLIRHGEFKGWLYPLTIIGTLNRETFGLIVPLHLAEFGLNRKPLKHSLGLFLTWMSTVLLLRAAFGVRPSFPDRPLMTNVYEIGWPIFLYSLAWLLPLIFFKRLPPFLRRAILLFAPPLLAANFLFGKVEETRLFLSLAIVLIPSTFIILFGSEQDTDQDAIFHKPQPEKVIV